MLVQHYRARHAADRFDVYYDENIEQQAWRLFRVKHGEKTMQQVELMVVHLSLGEVCQVYYCACY